MHTACYTNDLNDTARVDAQMQVAEDGHPSHKSCDMPRQGQGVHGRPLL